MTPKAVVPRRNRPGPAVWTLILLGATVGVLTLRHTSASGSIRYLVAAAPLALATVAAALAVLGDRAHRRRAEADTARLRADGVTTRGRIVAVQAADPRVRSGRQTLRLTIAYRTAGGERVTTPYSGRFPPDALPQPGLPATVRYLPADLSVVAVTLPETTILDLDGYLPAVPGGESAGDVESGTDPAQP
ncbi:DUF3592 domain-containing protein [Streptomyces sp. SID3343]|uniref:DUF3592 domain-containing protein n=1 Tax=Streptomyces sp. SID3343 TaxID=2690260 RepID=UPI00136D9DB0|nr:DUF3592 domain-containing protein [Streptomyces sp. SID3343]MYW00641.1 DUF3592 domain-containing protein [Streptomyces sp. SID3343]